MIRDYILVIAPNGTRQLNVKGSYVKIADSSLPSESVKVEGWKDGATLINASLPRLGALRIDQNYELLSFTNDTGSEMTLVVFAGDGEYESPEGEINVTLSAYGSIKALPEKTLDGSAQYFAENLARKKIVVRAHPNNMGSVWIAASAGNGIELTPGAVFDEAITGRVYTTADTNGDKVQAYEVE